MIFELLHSIFQLISQIFFGIIQAIVIIIVTFISQIVHSKTFQSCLELSRPGNSILAAAFVAIIAIISGSTDLRLILTASAVATVITAGGNSINDYYDREIDAINKPDRPIPSKRIKSHMVLSYSIVLLSMGVFLSLFLNFYALVLAVLNSVLLFLYASHIKKTGFLGNIAISYLTGSVFLFGGAVVDTATSWWIGIILGVSAFLITAGREIVKDIEDKKGDKAAGAKTLPIVMGEIKSSLIASSFLLIVIILSPIPYLLGIFHWVYLPVIALTDIILLYSIYLILVKSGKKSAALVQKYLKTAIIIALLAFITGSYNIYELLGSFL